MSRAWRHFDTSSLTWSGTKRHKPGWDTTNREEWVRCDEAHNNNNKREPQHSPDITEEETHNLSPVDVSVIFSPDSSWHTETDTHWPTQRKHWGTGTTACALFAFTLLVVGTLRHQQDKEEERKKHHVLTLTIKTLDLVFKEEKL